MSAGENLWKTPRLIFRAVETTDELFLATLNSNSQNLLNAAFFIPLPQNTAAIQKFREYIEAALVGLLICLPHEKWSGNDKSKPIGVITLSREAQKAHHRHAGIGINILPEFTGKGYGSEAIGWILEYAFMTVGLHRVEIGCFEFNRGAGRLYERLGFTREGFSRDTIFSQGRWWGEFKMGMLEDEWRELGKKGAL